MVNQIRVGTGMFYKICDIRHNLFGMFPAIAHTRYTKCERLLGISVFSTCAIATLYLLRSFDDKELATLLLSFNV